MKPQAAGFGRFWPALLIAIAGAAVYANSLSGPFVFDDVGSIPANPTIRHLWPLGPVLAPHFGGSTVSGRPMLNLSLALNYALGGTRVGGYHAVNLLIHLLAGLALLGVASRTLRTRPVLAFAIALIWTVHPLQTEAVTYLIQRAESLMGLFYLLTLYCFIRAADGCPPAIGTTPPAAGAPTGKGWGALAVLACLLGMATKENMVSAPVVALLYDRTFLAGSFRAAWRRRWPLFLGLASTWILLGYLVIGGGADRGGSIGFASDVPWWGYGLTQFQAIAHYLRLAVWPYPLVFEYGTFWATSAAQVVPYACVVGPLLVATLVALWRWPRWGFLGFWFFAILAPTSLLSTATQMIVEHRMYLALAPLLAAVVCGGEWMFGWVVSRGQWPRAIGSAAAAGASRGSDGAWLVGLLVFAGICAALTMVRNEDYRTELALWSDTVAKRPNNALAHNNLGKVLATQPGQLAAAVAQFQAALRLEPNFAEAHNNLGNVWAATPGRLDDAIREFEAALRLKSDYMDAHYNLANAWLNQPGRLNDAIEQYQAALRLSPTTAGIHNNLGYALMLAGRTVEAIPHYEAALSLNPDGWETQFNLAIALLRLPGRRGEAKAHLEAVLRLQPGNDQARQILAQIQASPP